MNCPEIPPRATTEPIRELFHLAEFSDAELIAAFQVLSVAADTAAEVTAKAGEVVLRLLLPLVWEGLARDILELNPDSDDVEDVLKRLG